MAVITCVSCSAKVNEGATACPECGANPRTGEAHLDWSRLSGAPSEVGLAGAPRTREHALPIGLCVAGGVWALVVCALGSIMAASIGVEAGDADPPRHIGLRLLMLGYLAVALVAFWAAARTSSDPRFGGSLALAAFVLGYVPIAAIALVWDLVEPFRLGFDVLIPILLFMWTLGGSILLLAMASVWASARHGGRRSMEAAPDAQVRGSGPAGTLSNTTATPSSRGDDVHDHDTDHDHQTPGTSLEPGVDARSGQLERHCSQCGALLEGSHEFCQVCALEASGGEPPPEDDTD